jgi:hypothetical protein
MVNFRSLIVVVFSLEALRGIWQCEDIGLDILDDMLNQIVDQT